MRLRRLAPKAVAKDDELVVPIAAPRRPTSRTDAGRRCSQELDPAAEIQPRTARASLRSAMSRRASRLDRRRRRHA